MGDHVLVFCRTVPAGGTLKLLAVWRGPYRVVQVHREGRWYVLSNGHKAHYENVIPYRSISDEWAVTKDQHRAQDVVIDPDREEPIGQQWTMMTDFETISNDSEEASFREEFLQNDEPIDRELEAKRPDKPFEMHF